MGLELNGDSLREPGCLRNLRVRVAGAMPRTGRQIDPRGYFTIDGRATADAQRDAEYTVRQATPSQPHS